jgi:hypothetical protein
LGLVGVVWDALKVFLISPSFYKKKEHKSKGNITENPSKAQRKQNIFPFPFFTPKSFSFFIIFRVKKAFVDKLMGKYYCYFFFSFFVLCLFFIHTIGKDMWKWKWKSFWC